MIVHVRLAHEICRVTISIGFTSPSHGNEITIDESAIHLQNDHVLVDTGLSTECRLQDRLILNLPIEVVYRFIDGIA